ncbi:hypothetical protein GOP47_0004907 [Adiantum capillus-veneris]|uniref:CBS domain-containing protein n=1 Tax=Adiantum capillus-veneris TaxID=13818 RepID=A0A9D4V564_ADICA|nr:hypothetical protein GOP47_0004907 [Adiantum capillus-veneris]
MAIALLSHEVRDLILGKPSLLWLAASASVRSALVALKQNEDVCEISVWDCAPGSHANQLHPTKQHIEVDDSHPTYAPCRCIGKMCMQRIICYLASEKSLCNVAAALNEPVSVLLEGNSTRIQHIDPEASLYEALTAISTGAQNLVVQISDSLKKHGHALKGSTSFNKKPMTEVLSVNGHNGHNYCWLTHEDVLRFLLGSISVFSPLPRMSIQDLGIIQTDILMVGVDDEASSALEAIKFACLNQMAVAVVDKKEGEDGPFQIVGEISCSTFQTCNETAAIALASLSVYDFITYVQDWRSTPDMLIEAMAEKLSKRSMLSKCTIKNQHDVSQLLHDLESWELSSDDEFGNESPTGPHDLLHTHHLTHFHSVTRAGCQKSHSGPIFCRPTSSLIAVLMQALAHREHYVWVTNEDSTLVGMVTFAGILSVLSRNTS